MILAHLAASENHALWFLLAAALIAGALFGAVFVASKVKPYCEECGAWRREQLNRPWWLR